MNTSRTHRDKQTYRDDELVAAARPARDGPGPVREHPARLVPSSRYRHPGDVIRLIAAGLILIVTLAAVTLAPSQLVGTGASAVTWLGADPAGRLLVGLVQVAFVVAATGIVAVTLRRRRFRLVASLAAGAVVAGAALAGILYLTGDRHPHAVAANVGHGSWLASAAFPGPALLAGAVAVTVAASPWLSRPWRRAAWITLCAAGAARLVAGTVLPVELILALAAGMTVGAGVLVALGVPDPRRCDPPACQSVPSPQPTSKRRAPARSSRSPMTGGVCSSRLSARISVTPTCCTGRTGSPGYAMSATRGPRPRLSRRLSTRPSPE